jgi:hypothetical protein
MNTCHLPIPAVKTTSICLLLAMLSAARATIPEPDNLIYGSIVLDGTLVTAARSDVVVEARRTTNGPAIASYRMGSDPALGSFYSLRLVLESVAPVSDTNASQISDSVFISVTDGSGLRAQTSYLIADRGVAERVDFGAAAVDSDGDGLPDAWELQRYSNLNQSPGSLAPNGMTALQNFIAGTDPNDPNGGFRLRIELTNQQKQVSFTALRAEGPGYDGMTRLYTLESNPTFAAASWTAVPSYTDIAGNNQTVDYLTGALDTPNFFRGKVLLQGFTVPRADSDGDGLPDAWETMYFGTLDQNANSRNLNGQTALQNFIAGNNPNDTNDVFKLRVALSGGNMLVSFYAVQAQGTGYEGSKRYYALETSTGLGAGWTAIAGYSNISGNDQMLVYQSPNTAPLRFCRIRVWLQP